MPHLTAEIFLKINPDNMRWLPWILGMIWSTIVGGVHSLIYVISLELTKWNPSDNYDE